MNNIIKKTILAFAISTFVFTGCSPKINTDEQKPQTNVESKNSTEDKQSQIEDNTNIQDDEGNKNEAVNEPIKEVEEKEPIDYNVVKPNEVGKVMVVMFHNFVDTYDPKKHHKYWTTTFDNFEKLLNTLYEKDYSLISLTDYLDNNVDVPAGKIPIVFTFDDGTQGQFNLVEEDGKLVVNNKSAVGVMQKFYESHPDFGMKATFYINLESNSFSGAGTMSERLKYLADMGFEIGNHTYSHYILNQAKKADDVIKEVGGNQKKLNEIFPGYIMNSLALPTGAYAPKEFRQYEEKGEYQGIKYLNRAIMEVGWDPTYSPVDFKFNPLSTHRVRAAGMVNVDADLTWWLGKLSRGEQYISDGEPDTIVIPETKQSQVNSESLKDKELIIY